MAVKITNLFICEMIGIFLIFVKTSMIYLYRKSIEIQFECWLTGRLQIEKDDKEGS